MTEKDFTVSHAEVLAAISGNRFAVETLTEQLSTHKISVRELERAVRMIKAGVETLRAVELAKIEAWYDLGEAYKNQSEDGVTPFLQKIKLMLEMILRYIDNVSDELPQSSSVQNYWFSNVRIPIHNTIDAVIKSQKQIRRNGQNQDTSCDKEHPVAVAQRRRSV